MAKIYSNSVETKFMIDKFTLDLYGDHLLNTGFRYLPFNSPLKIVKLSEKYQSRCFEGNFSLN